MERRRFLEGCAMLSGIAAVARHGAFAADAAAHRFPPALLVDGDGRPIRARSIAVETNYVFHYPFASTPCFLLNLGAPLDGADKLERADGATYAWPGGVGRERSLVAFSAICAHKLAYPTREVSFIRYQKDKSPTSAAHVIHCCADHSVYDPSRGARVVSGPAPQPLAAILLDYDERADELRATGTLGAEQFDAFFAKYAFKLEMEYGGAGGAAKPVGGTTLVRELTDFCRNPVSC